MFADSSPEVVYPMIELKPSWVPCLMPCELWGDLLSVNVNCVHQPCLSSESHSPWPFQVVLYPSLVNFLIAMPWSACRWNLKVDSLQISRVFSLCSSLLSGSVLYILYPTWPFWILLSSWRWPGFTRTPPSPHTAWEPSQGSNLGQSELISFVFHLSRITVLQSLTSVSWSYCFLYFACVVLFCSFPLVSGQMSIWSPSVSLSCPEVEV